MRSLNSLQTIEEKMEKSTFFSRVIPGSIGGRVVLFFFLPLFLLLSTLWIALIEPTALSPYICGLLLFGTVMSCQSRIKGLLISVAAVVAVYAFKHSGYTLFEIGLCVAAICDFVIAFLAMTEIKTLLITLVNESKSHMNEFLAKKQELLEVEDSFSKTKEQLEAEIASWKEKAEQRKIDLQMAKDRMLLIQSEIEMLTAQKESILNEAYEIRKEARSQLATLKEQIAEVDRAREEVHRRLDSAADIEEEREKLKRAEEENEQRIVILKSEYNERFIRLEKEFEEKLRLAAEASAQLEEKMAMPSVEMQKLEAALAQKERELEESFAKKEAELHKKMEQTGQLEEKEAELRLKTGQLKESYAQIETELRLKIEQNGQLEESFAKKEAELRNEIAALQAKGPSHANLEGLYKQLRSQFEEKSRILVETRGELFAAQTELESIKLQKQMDELSDRADIIRDLEAALDQSSRECEALEEEISSLEGLISHILSQ